jgi:hypothetical protein
MSFAQYILEKSFFYIAIIIFCYLFNKIWSRYCFKFIKTYIKRKKSPLWFRYSLIKPMLKTSFYIIPSIVLYICLSYNSSSILYLRILSIAISTYFIIVLTIFLTSFIEFLEAIYSQNKYAIKANISIKTISQPLKLLYGYVL